MNIWVLVFSVCFRWSLGQNQSLLRVKRLSTSPTPGRLTGQQKDEIVRLHNEFRMTQGAANMNYMVWSDALANLAVKWAVKCEFNHGQPSESGASTTSASLGQNLWSTIESFVAGDSVKAWFNESVHYDYHTARCADPPCEHYTQVVWGESHEVGCGYAFCPQLTGKTGGGEQNAYYVVCNYSPAGNVKGEKPYIQGEACTKCPSGRGQCYKGLCRNCSKEEVTCACRLKCHNCGIINKAKCTCGCHAGWHGTDCSEACKDKHENCRKINSTSCALENYKIWAPKNCPALCGVCDVANGEQNKCDGPQEKVYKVINSAVSHHARQMALLYAFSWFAVIFLSRGIR